MKVMFITPDLGANSLGRTYCLHLLCEQLGWPNETWAARPGAVWAPLRRDLFATTCHAPASTDTGHTSLLVAARKADLIVAVKPVPASFDVAWVVARQTDKPLLLDIDDPDLEVLLASGQPRKAALKWVARTSTMYRAVRARRRARKLVTTVSNPHLQELYGGQLIPHVRRTPPPRIRPMDDRRVLVSFVGTPNAHKGTSLLREAVASIADQGYALIVTSQAPADAAPHETWTGVTDLATGLQMVSNADVVAIPSLDTAWSRGQLPVKLVDAMLAGTPVIVSNIPPLPWAVGDAGLVVRPGDVSSLREALLILRDASERRDRGRDLLSRGQSLFGIELCSARFAAACHDAAAG